MCDNFSIVSPHLQANLCDIMHKRNPTKTTTKFHTIIPNPKNFTAIDPQNQLNPFDMQIIVAQTRMISHNPIY